MRKTYFTFILMFSSLFSFSQVNLTLGLVAYYPLNFSGQDSSANNLDLTAYGTPISAINRFGVSGGAYTLNAAHPDYLTGPSSALMSPPEITISAWVKLINPMNDQKVAGRAVVGSGYLMGVDSNKLDAEIWDLNSTHYRLKAGNITANTWTHLVMSFKANEYLRLYVNGQPVDSMAAGASVVGYSTTWPFTVGGAPWGSSTLNLTGGVDDIYVYSRALNNAEVLALYNITATGIHKNNVAVNSVYPVPAKDRLYIEMKSFTAPSSVQIIDAIGKIVYNDQIIYSGRKEIDISNLQNGIYSVLLFSGSEVETHSIVINN